MFLRCISSLPSAYRSHIVLTMVLGVLSLSVVGCGFGSFQQRDPWREEAEKACIGRKEIKPSVHIVRSESIDGPGVCGISYPLKVSALAHGDVMLTSRATLGCPMVSRSEKWLSEVVQPASMLFFGQPVTHMRVGSYACRSRNNQRGAKLSEHSFGNALDVMSFKLADGREITVVKGWKGHPSEQDFLREIFVGACQHFNTVLGPGSDMFHYDHFHLDLARHDARGLRKVCRPVIKYTPQLNNPHLTSPLQSFAPTRAPISGMGVPAPSTAVTSKPSVQPAFVQPVHNGSLLKSSTLNGISQRKEGLPQPLPLPMSVPLPLQPNLQGAPLDDNINEDEAEQIQTEDASDGASSHVATPQPPQERGMFEKIGGLFR